MYIESLGTLHTVGGVSLHRLKRVKKQEQAFAPGLSEARKL
jgi:hypothetical protein